MRICFLMEPPRSPSSVTYQIIEGLKEDGADVEIVTDALPVLQGAVLPPDLAGLPGDSAVRRDLALREGRQKSIDIGHHDLL